MVHRTTSETPQRFRQMLRHPSRWHSTGLTCVCLHALSSFQRTGNPMLPPSRLGRGPHRSAVNDRI